MCDRASYAFALVSVATALDIEEGVVRAARIALGGVAHKPWRVCTAESVLAGHPLSDQRCREAAELVTAGARAYRDSQLKIALAQRAVVHALRVAEGGI